MPYIKVKLPNVPQVTCFAGQDPHFYIEVDDVTPLGLKKVKAVLLQCFGSVVTHDPPLATGEEWKARGQHGLCQGDAG